MRGARALLFPQLEDFGMTPLEVAACGRPTIAYGAGGALDTVIDGRTGILASEQTVDSFVEAILRFEALPPFNVGDLVRHAASFSRERYVTGMRSFVRSAWEARNVVEQLPLRYRILNESREIALEAIG